MTTATKPARKRTKKLTPLEEVQRRAEENGTSGAIESDLVDALSALRDATTLAEAFQAIQTIRDAAQELHEEADEMFHDLEARIDEEESA